MAAHDTQANGVWTSGTTFTWNHTFAASSIGAIWVGFTFAALSAITGITVGGSAATFVTSSSNGSGANRLELWKHNTPSSGSQAIVVTFDSAPSEAIGVSASATSASGWGAGVASGPTSNTTPSITIGSLGSSDLPYGGVFTPANPAEQDTAVSERASSQFVNVERQSTGGDGVLNWTQGTSDEWLCTGFRAIDSGGASPEKNFLTLLGAGA